MRIDPIPNPGRHYLPSYPVGGIQTCLATRDRGKEARGGGAWFPKEPSLGMSSPKEPSAGMSG
ncbi:MAG: hypothetical protein M0Q91_16990 [Methanoregula sp.]|nr:hypothetical protein [Methanoregula sp.]